MEKSKKNFEWDFVYCHNNTAGYRSKVPLGWIYKEEIENEDNGYVIQLSLLFIPDPEHKWEINENEEV